MADKLDLKRTLAQLYAPKAGDFALVDVPPLSFLMIDGAGDPNTSADYASAVEALYSTSYALKFMIRKADGIDYAVMPLEGLWWADDMTTFVARRKGEWRWTMMILQPEPITAEHVRAAVDQVVTRKGLARAADLRFETYHEGQSLQILHVGSYDAEAPTLARLHDEVMPARGLTFNGRHHEIYLSDPRRTAPDKLRTILRQPVRAISSTAAG